MSLPDVVHKVGAVREPPLQRWPICTQDRECLFGEMSLTWVGAYCNTPLRRFILHHRPLGLEVLPILFEIRSLGGFQAHRDFPEALVLHEQPKSLNADVSFADMLVAASAILFDPIFQGLAISLMAGEVASLLLSRVTVPLLYYLSKRQ